MSSSLFDSAPYAADLPRREPISEMDRCAELAARGVDLAELVAASAYVFRSVRGRARHGVMSCSRLLRQPVRVKTTVESLLSQGRCDRCGHLGDFAQLGAWLTEAERLIDLRDRMAAQPPNGSWDALTDIRDVIAYLHRPADVPVAPGTLRDLADQVLRAAEQALAAHPGVDRESWELDAAAWYAQPDGRWHQGDLPLPVYAVNRARSALAETLRTTGSLDAASSAGIRAGCEWAHRLGADPKEVDPLVVALVDEVRARMTAKVGGPDHVVVLPAVPPERRVQRRTAPADPLLFDGADGPVLYVVPAVVADWLASFAGSICAPGTYHPLVEQADLGPVPNAPLEAVLVTALALQRDGGAHRQFRDAWASAAAVLSS